MRRAVSGRYRFKATDSSSEVARGVIAALMAELRAHEAGASLGSEPEHVHKIRVATRRLRAALTAFDSCVPARAGQALAGDLRWLAAQMGDNRDLDIVRERIDQWMREGAISQQGRAALQALLEPREKRARTQVERALRSKRYARLLTRGDGLITPPPEGDEPTDATPVVVLARAGLRKRVRRFRRAAKGCSKADRRADDADTDSLHRLRLAAKKLRYTAEIFAPLFGSSYRRNLGALVEVQGLLGDLQDCVTVRQLALRLTQQALSEQASAEDRLHLHALGQMLGACGVRRARTERRARKLIKKHNLRSRARSFAEAAQGLVFRIERCSTSRR